MLNKQVLSPREHQVCALLAEGLRDREIAEKVGLAIHTIRAYVKSSFRKLGIHKRIELVLVFDTPYGVLPEVRQLTMEERELRAKCYKVYTQAVSSGLIVRRPCVRCGRPQTDGHHADYNRPLDVIWLCRSHHAEEHSRARLAAMTKDNGE